MFSSHKIITLTIGIFAALVLFGVSHQATLAALIGCRSDPIIVLSNGTLVDVSADVDTTLWNVTEVHYTVHVPAGTKPVLIIRTKAWLTSQETFSIYSDNAANAYSSSTMVQANTSNTAVTASMLVNLDYRQASGVTGQTLNINLSDN